MGFVIETESLTKFYGKNRGIEDVSLQINSGEIFGFIGPNGAGKSTTIRLLLNLIKKSSGNATIFGLDCQRESAKILAHVGYLPSELYYYDNMKAIDLLRYSTSFYPKDSRQDCLNRVDYLAEFLELDLNKKIEEMSLGNRKKVGIIQSLLHSPTLLILDEPTSGLDPLMQKKFFDLIRAENKKGTTVLFSSHVLSDVQRICDRVAIIKDGHIVKVCPISDIANEFCKKVTYTVGKGSPVKIPSGEGITDGQIHDRIVSFMYRKDCASLLALLAKQKITDLEICDPPLEEVFMRYYGNN